MSQDLGVDFAAGPSVSGLFGSNITAGNSQTSSAIDLGNPGPSELGFKIKIATGTGTPAGNKQWVVAVLWSHDNTDFTDADLGEVVERGTIAASATDIICLSIPVQARYCKIHVDNDQSSGPDITTSSSIVLTDLFGDQV